MVRYRHVRVKETIQQSNATISLLGDNVSSQLNVYWRNWIDNYCQRTQAVRFLPRFKSDQKAFLRFAISPQPFKLILLSKYRSYFFRNQFYSFNEF